MPKNIVICSDGTGNSAVKGRGTNVFKMYEAVDVVGHLSDAELCEQVAIYDDGVGTQKLKLIRTLSGALGWGLARNVRQLYGELATVYEENDNIYLFGFSRGAFTVRTLAGFIQHCKLVCASDLESDGQLERVVADCYRSYRESNPALLERLLRPLAKLVRAVWRPMTRKSMPKTEPRRLEPNIRLVGVWDTVDAVGFPVPGIAGFWNKVVYHFKFEDQSLPKGIHQACHALAIDEERATFQPTLWDEKGDDRVDQVWFAGVHSNVGGGYPKQGLSLVALDWMMRKAEAANPEHPLRLEPTQRNLYRGARNVDGNLYDSRSGPSVYYRYGPRDAARLCKDRNAKVRVHHSALDRAQRGTRGYAPTSLPTSFDVVGNIGETPPHQGPVRLASKNEPQGAEPFARAAGWMTWRKLVQYFFYIAQLSLIWRAVEFARSDPESIERSLPKEGLLSWLLGAADSAVAVVPGEFVQNYVVHPMFAYPWLGITFVLVFPICYFLGLMGRVNQHTRASKSWKQVEIQSTRPPASGAPVT